MPRALDITGERYGRLIGVRRVGAIHRDSLWEFLCDCGTTMQTMLCKVRQGHTRSCGCLQKDVTRDRVYVHGKSNGGGRQKETRLYRIWQGMKARCSDPVAHPRYAGRGISICREWHDDFPAFEAWALSHGYHDTLSIDRVNNDGGYSPENCRWATAKQQAANRGGKFAKRI